MEREPKAQREHFPQPSIDEDRGEGLWATKWRKMSKSHKKARHKIGDGKTTREEKNFSPLYTSPTFSPLLQREGKRGKER